MLSRRFVFGRIGQFLVTPKDDNTPPLIAALNIIDFQAYEWIRAHAIDLVAHGGKSEKVVTVISNIDRNYVGLMVHLTS
jgi:hypothetical protein